MKSNSVKIGLKIFGIIFEILGILGGFFVPVMFTIILPISNALKYYSNGGEGISMIVKTTLVVVCLSPLLAVVIFAPLFIIGAAVYTWVDESEEKNNTPQQPIIVQAPQPQQNPMDDFVIVKEDNPHQSDAGIAQMNYIYQQKKKEQQEEQ